MLNYSMGVVHVGVEWRTQDARLVFQPLHRSNVQGPNFEITSTDPYFGAGEKGVMLPLRIKM